MGLTDWLNIFRIGQEVANPALWKTGQAAVSVAALAVAGLNIAKQKYPVLAPLTPDIVNNFTVAAFAFFNAAATVATSKKVGVLPAKE